MIAVQLWLRCSVPGCDAVTECMTPLLEVTYDALVVSRRHVPLPEGWQHGPHFHNAAVCPRHQERRGDRDVRDDHLRPEGP